jgi:hypothetical protein
VFLIAAFRTWSTDIWRDATAVQRARYPFTPSRISCRLRHADPHFLITRHPTTVDNRIPWWGSLPLWVALPLVGREVLITVFRFSRGWHRDPSRWAREA